MDKAKIIKFITGNNNKALEVEQIIKNILPNIKVEAVKVDDIPELQGEPEEIAKEKLKHVRKFIKDGIIMVEDTSLCFNSYKGLPGPYIKDFLNKIGLDGLTKMASALGDNTAYAQCIFALSENVTDEPKLFIGRTSGKIVDRRGPNSFGWDPIFEPDEGNNRTYSELPKEEKNKISHRYKSLNALADYYKSI